MQASATTLENNRVKLTVEVEESAIDVAMDATAKAFANDIAIKGFRKGKAPRSMIEARIGGPQVLRAEALNAALPDFYARAVADTLIDPIGQPSVHIVSGETEGDLVFEAEVEVRPELPLAGHRDLKVTVPAPYATDEDIDGRIKALLANDATLQVVDRGVVTGDHVLLRVHGEDPVDPANVIDVDDFTYEVGTNQITDGVDELIVGLKTGEHLELIGRGPGGVPMKWDFDIKEVNEQVLPELTDEWVEENSEFASVEALRDAVSQQISRMKVVEAQMSRRDATLEALGNLIEEGLLPEVLIESETESRVHELQHRLSNQGLELDTFLRVTNQSAEDLIAILKDDAKKAVRVDLALRALARVENLDATDEEVDEELATTAASMGADVDVLRENLRDSGRVIAFRAEVTKLKSSRWLYENVTYIDPSGAEIDKSLFEVNQSDAFGG